MKPTDFAKLLTAYLSRHLPGQRNVSVNTIKSYRDTFKLFLHFCHVNRGISPEYLTIICIDEELIYAFLSWVENVRKCSISTRNQRLAAIHAFFRYVQIEAPEIILPCQRILAIPFKKHGKPTVSYLTVDALKAILKQPDRTKPAERRDLALLTILYDTGARVQELIDLVVKDIRFQSPAIVVLTGKGGKTRHVPLMSKTAKILSDYLVERSLNTPFMQEHAVFYNSQRKMLTRAGVGYIINKYIKAVRVIGKTPLPDKISPHVFRHTKAMHLLQANVNLVYIRDLLGHVNISTTEIYAKADLEVKRQALEKAYIEIVTDEIPAWSENEGLMNWLQNFCN